MNKVFLFDGETCSWDLGYYYEGTEPICEWANAKVAPLIARLKEQEELLNDAEELAKTAVMLLEKMGRGHFTQTIACYCEWLDKRQKAKAEK